ncbi:MAG TPA: sugar phosphate nucleotidyltransferase [Methylomirabilota bacterium]|jgi:mannose-1-phosphate guanylyltransferase|nr:sugar phosphate nucleotidyltransferase [Methylomirabilota bacterium]
MGAVASGRPDARDRLWAVVLAGGEGVRLRPLIHRLYGEDRPKQFAALVGSRSLLRQTLDRVRLAVPAEQTVIVTHQNHQGYLPEALDGASVGRVLMQPEDRGTAAGILLPSHWIHRCDPDAIVAVFPSDHFIREEQLFMDHVVEVADAVREHPEWLVLLGAAPTHPEPDYGWIEPDEVVGCTAAGQPLSRVRRFWEKPSTLSAGVCLQQGWLWNTFVIVARVSVLLAISRQLLPRLHESLSVIAPFWGTETEEWAFRQAYASAPKANFSRSVLELNPPSLVVSRLPTLNWSDLGTPERMVKALKAAQLLPRWFDESDVVQTPAAEGRQRSRV